MARQMTSAEFARLKNVNVQKIIRLARRYENTAQRFGKRLPGPAHGSWVFTLADSERYDHLAKRDRPATGDLHVRVPQLLLDEMDKLADNRSEAVREALEQWIKKNKRRSDRSS